MGTDPNFMDKPLTHRSPMWTRVCVFEIEIFKINSREEISKVCIKLNICSLLIFLQNIAQGIFAIQLKLCLPVSEICVFVILSKNGCMKFFLGLEVRCRY